PKRRKQKRTTQLQERESKYGLSCMPPAYVVRLTSEPLPNKRQGQFHCSEFTSPRLRTRLIRHDFAREQNVCREACAMLQRMREEWLFCGSYSDNGVIEKVHEAVEFCFDQTLLIAVHAVAFWAVFYIDGRTDAVAMHTFRA